MLFAGTESWQRTAADGNVSGGTDGCQQGENIHGWKVDREKKKVWGKIDLWSSSLQVKRLCFFPLLQKKFILNLLGATQRLTPGFAVTNSDVISHIINCSTGILLLSGTKCDLDVHSNPKVSLLVQQFTPKMYLVVTITMLTGLHPQNLFEDVYEIFHTVAWLLGSQSTESFIIKHSMGTIYQSRWGAHKRFFNHPFNWKSVLSDWVWICSVLYSHTLSDISNAVLGSPEDGEYIKLPSYSAMMSQIGGHHRITAQVCGVFFLHHFTWPVLTFNRTFLPLRWQHSQQIPTRLMTASQGWCAAWYSARESRKYSWRI